MRSFGDEYAQSLVREIDGVTIRAIGLSRVIASKRATGRPKDLAQMPALEATLRAKETE